MSLVTNVRWGLDTAWGLKVGKCLKSMMQAQVYLYHIFHP